MNFFFKTMSLLPLPYGARSLFSARDSLVSHQKTGQQSNKIFQQALHQKPVGLSAEKVQPLPNNKQLASTISKLGEIYLDTGCYEDARKKFEKAYELDPDTYVYRHLAQIVKSVEEGHSWPTV